MDLDLKLAINNLINFSSKWFFTLLSTWWTRGSRFSRSRFLFWAVVTEFSRSLNSLTWLIIMSNMFSYRRLMKYLWTMYQFTLNIRPLIWDMFYEILFVSLNFRWKHFRSSGSSFSCWWLDHLKLSKFFWLCLDD